MGKSAIIYLLDPDTTIFRPMTVPTDTGFKPIYQQIGCRLVDLVRFDDRHYLFVDEDGLSEGMTSFTIFDGYPQPLAGKIVLAGMDGPMGFSTPQISLHDAGKRFECCRPVLDPVFSSTDYHTPDGYIGFRGLKGFQARIERRAPTVVEGQS